MFVFRFRANENTDFMEQCSEFKDPAITFWVIDAGPATDQIVDHAS